MQDISVRGQRVKFLKSLTARAGRLRAQKFLVEGPQAVRELVAHRSDQVVDVYVADQAKPQVHEIADAARAQDRFVHFVDETIIRAVSKDSQGIVAVSRMPQVSQIPVDARNIVWLWQVRDPGNLGTIIRTADAAGADAVVLSPDSADPFNPKVVRATAGSLFHIPVFTDVDDEQMFAVARQREVPVWALSGYGEDNLFDLPGADLARPKIWLFGNEARGLEESLMQAANRRVHIPLFGQAESLNLSSSVAVCLYAAAGQKR